MQHSPQMAVMGFTWKQCLSLVFLATSILTVLTFSVGGVAAFLAFPFSIIFYVVYRILAFLEPASALTGIAQRQAVTKVFQGVLLGLFVFLLTPNHHPQASRPQVS
jgi:hypothetical protein